MKTRTKVTIGLARADYQRLLHDVPSQHPAYTVLRRCPDLDRWADEKPFSLCVLIECSQEQAMALYEAAQQHCPLAFAGHRVRARSGGAAYLVSYLRLK